MRQKFFTNTIQSKFIKNLLLNTSLPIWNSCRDGDYLINGFTYVYNNYLIKCTKSGILGSSILESKADIKVVERNFVFGRNYPMNTKVFESSSNFYDSETHKFLGEYLRFYRDILKTDLMPFYNCFNGIYTSKFYIDTNKSVVKQSNYDYYQQGNDYFNDRYHTKENFKVVMVPIKFNKEYTIAIDCNAEVVIAPCFINHGQLMQVEYGGLKLNLTTELNNVSNSITRFTNLIFNSPIKIKINNNSKTILRSNHNTIPNDNIEGPLGNLPYEQFLQTYENYLNLLIQLPSNNESSIVVLEGDYTDLPDLYTENYIDDGGNLKTRCGISRNIINIDSVEEIPDDELDSILLSKLSLLTINDELRYPYSDRLVSYLLWNIIDNNEDIGNNVLRVQEKVGINTKTHPGGYYDKYIRTYIYNLYRNNNKYINNDNNGYIDKDVEVFLFN